MATPLSIILSWFEKGDFPTQAQFAKSWSSFWHKEEAIAQENIENLVTDLDNKAEKQQLTDHINDPNAHDGSGSGSGGRFGIEDNTTDKDRSVDMGSNNLNLTGINEFNLSGPVQYQFIENLEDINLVINGAAVLPEYDGKTIVFKNGGIKITENNEPLTVQIMEGKASTEYDFIEATVNLGSSGDLYIYYHEPMLNESSSITGYYGNVSENPKVNFNLPEEGFNGQKIVVFNESTNAMALANMPETNAGNDTANDVFNRGAEVNVNTNVFIRTNYWAMFTQGDNQQGNYAETGLVPGGAHQTVIRRRMNDGSVSETVFEQSGIYEGYEGMTDRTSFLFRGGYVGYAGDFSDALIDMVDVNSNEKFTTMLTVKKLIAKYFSENQIQTQGYIAVHDNPYNMYSKDLTNPITLLEYMNTVDADWYLPDPAECIGKTIIIVPKGPLIKLRGTIFKVSPVTELGILSTTTLRALDNNGKPQWCG